MNVVNLILSKYKNQQIKINYPTDSYFKTSPYSEEDMVSAFKREINPSPVKPLPSTGVVIKNKTNPNHFKTSPYTENEMVNAFRKEINPSPVKLLSSSARISSNIPIKTSGIASTPNSVSKNILGGIKKFALGGLGVAAGVGVGIYAAAAIANSVTSGGSSHQTASNLKMQARQTPNHM